MLLNQARAVLLVLSKHLLEYVLIEDNIAADKGHKLAHKFGGFFEIERAVPVHIVSHPNTIDDEGESFAINALLLWLRFFLPIYLATTCSLQITILPL